MQATAFIAAAARAKETSAPRPRLRDEYAADLVATQVTGQAARRRILAAGTDEVIHRTVMLDRMVLSAAEARPILVNLGAGLCTRPYRLDLSGYRRVVECDAPGLLALKAEVLAEHAPSCPVERIALDVRNSSALAAALDKLDGENVPVVVLSEGLLVYLSPNELDDLADTLASCLAAPTWLADIVSVASAQSMTQSAVRAGTRLSLYGLDSLSQWESRGWTVADYRPLPAPARSAGRQTGPATHQIVDGVLAVWA